MGGKSRVGGVQIPFTWNFTGNMHFLTCRLIFIQKILIFLQRSSASLTCRNSLIILEEPQRNTL
jgi:hypothetical protein